MVHNDNKDDDTLSSLPTPPNGTRYMSLSGTPNRHNHITSISKTALVPYGKMTVLVLSLAYSEIQTVEDGALGQLKYLLDVDLSHNEIKTIRNGMFKGLQYLRTIDLSGNEYCKIEANAFNGLNSLEVLILGGMKLSKLSNDTFNGLPKLKTLKLFDNSIKRLSPALFQPLASMRILDLSGNFLRDLDSDFKPQFMQLKSLVLSDNPWQCHCQLLWLRDLDRNLISNPLTGSEVICAGPDSLKYHSLLNVPEDKFKCIPPRVIRCDSSSYTVNVHNSLIVSCEIEGDPIPEVAWVRPDGWRIDGRDTAHGQYGIDDNGTLTISGAEDVDDGNWEIIVYNKTVSYNMAIHIKVIGLTTTTQSTSTSTTPKPTTSTTTESTIIKTTPTTTTITTTTARTTTTMKTTASTRIPTTTMQKTTTIYTTILTTFSKSQTTTSLVGSTIGASKAENSGIDMSIIIAGAAGGGTLITLTILIIIVIKKKKEKASNKVHPFKYDDL
ncbi:hypothetical protein CHS0354_041949 [Potamilus streckersoni]|uniref:Ig-like domain-containing protein n=1 Tax=Potamilus streckersoni TaxID=2493646 RepID=A0AAE0W9F2_9BIVA|nr:hypothetical protein CHS0354_041949 [Potamilus streckersoni]